jgi:V/A-type H+-transporting ATPase subunit D
VPEADGAVVATRVALLELRDERRLVQEGYELLDEKRVMLAAEILRQLRRHATLQERLAAHESAARVAFEAAVEMHGFDDLTVAPPRSLKFTPLLQDRRALLGIPLIEARLDRQPASPPATGLPRSPELHACADAFLELVTDHAALAACAGNLRRLIAEYTRTERRAGALENVLLPEIDATLRFVEEQLDAVDQEEAVRVRNAGRSAAGAGA